MVTKSSSVSRSNITHSGQVSESDRSLLTQQEEFYAPVDQIEAQVWLVQLGQSQSGVEGLLGVVAELQLFEVAQTLLLLEFFPRDVWFLRPRLGL